MGIVRISNDPGLARPLISKLSSEILKTLAIRRKMYVLLSPLYFVETTMKCRIKFFVYFTMNSPHLNIANLIVSKNVSGDSRVNRWMRRFNEEIQNHIVCSFNLNIFDLIIHPKAYKKSE